MHRLLPATLHLRRPHPLGPIPPRHLPPTQSQTSSGKTYTMRGTPSDPGIISLAVHEVFSIIEACQDREFLLRVSYMEVSWGSVGGWWCAKKGGRRCSTHEAHQDRERLCRSYMEVGREGACKIRQTGAQGLREECAGCGLQGSAPSCQCMCSLRSVLARALAPPLAPVLTTLLPPCLLLRPRRPAPTLGP